MLLYYITDRAQFAGDESARREQLLGKIAEATRAGVEYIQLREKDLSSRELEKLAREAARCTAGTETRLLINSRTDIALAMGANGVHLRSTDVSAADVRRIWHEAGSDIVPFIAVSCHVEQQVVAAKKTGADFVVFGPVFEKSHHHVVGLDALRSACRHSIGVLALGGVTLENAQSCVQAGAAGVAGIRLFQENEIESVVRCLR